MSVPWYASGGARPDYAKYQGWKADDKQRSETVARIKAAAANPAPTPTRSSWSPAPTPAPTPAPASAPAPVTQPRPDPSAWGGVVRAGSVTFGNPPPPEPVVPETPPIELPKTELDIALEKTWGNLENEGVSAYIKNDGVQPVRFTTQEQRDQIMQGLADRYDAQARRGQKALRARERAAKDRKEKYREVSLGEWDSFTPRQQAGIQSNADLEAAVQRDRNMMGKHSATLEELEEYQRAGEEIFGEDFITGASDGLEYAPNTLAFVADRGITRADTVAAGITLDDFLLMDTALNGRQIRNLHRDIPEPELTQQVIVTPSGAPLTIGVPVEGGEGLSVREARLRLAQKIARGQLRLQERLAGELSDKTDQIISTMTTTQATSSEGTAATLGASPKRNKQLEMTPDEAQWVNDYMEALARTDFTPEEAVAGIQTNLVERGLSEREQARTWNLIVHGAEMSALGEYGWFEDYQGEGTIGRSPTEVAALAGAPALKRRVNRGDSQASE